MVYTCASYPLSIILIYTTRQGSKRVRFNLGRVIKRDSMKCSSTNCGFGYFESYVRSDIQMLSKLQTVIFTVGVSFKTRYNSLYIWKLGRVFFLSSRRPVPHEHKYQRSITRTKPNRLHRKYTRKAANCTVRSVVLSNCRANLEEKPHPKPTGG